MVSGEEGADMEDTMSEEEALYDEKGLQEEVDRQADPLVELILDLRERMERLESDRARLESEREDVLRLIFAFAKECGYEIVTVNLGDGRMASKWQRKSGLVTL